MGSILKFGQRVEKSKENEYGWRILYQFRKGKVSEDSLLGHKSVICFAGDGGIYDEDLNGYCKNVELMLKKAGVKSSEMPAIYALGFDTETSVHRYQILKKTNSLRAGLSDPEYFYAKNEKEKKYWKPFFEAYFLPLLIQENGEPYSVQKIKENLQNLTILTHCHGGMFAHEIETELSNKLKELYPKQVKELMGQLRMLHISSRKLILPESQAKHFHIISQNDDKYADAGLEYDHLHEALNREKIQGNSLLLQPQKNEEILLFKQLTTCDSFGENADDHTLAMNIFSEQAIDPKLPENEAPIHLTQQVLKHFVLNPDDPRPLGEIVKSLDPLIVQKKSEQGQNYFQKLKEGSHVRRGLLSILSNPQVHMAPTKADRKIFLQRDDEGRNFYQTLLENYQKSGDNRSLISFLKSVKGFMNAKETLRGIEIAAARQDWTLANRFMRFAYVEKPEEIQSILDKVPPENLPKLYPLFQRAHLENSPKMVQDLMKKSGKIKHTLGRLKLQQFFSDLQKQNLEKFSKNEKNSSQFY